jgi:hypothetical protein
MFKTTSWKRRPYFSLWCMHNAYLVSSSWTIIPIKYEKTEGSRCSSAVTNQGRVSFLKWKSDWNTWNAFCSCNKQNKIQIPQPASEAFPLLHHLLFSRQAKWHTHSGIPQVHTLAHTSTHIGTYSIHSHTQTCTLSHKFLHWPNGSLQSDSVPYFLPPPHGFPPLACLLMELPFSL